MPVYTITDASCASTLNCVSDAVEPPTALPTGNDSYVNTLTPTVSAGPDPLCEGTKVYTFTYTDCAGNQATWTYTYTIDMPAFTITDAPGAKTVNCVADAVQPTTGLPVVKDACGNTLTPTVSAGADPTCEGTKVYTFTYKDCAGNQATWTYTYTIDMPAFTITDAPG